MSSSFSRREVLAAFLSAPAAACLGCGRTLGASLPAEGEIIGASAEVGHRVRDGFRLQPEKWQTVDVAIVGGGIAGLSAAWRLDALGIRDYVVLELEPVAGGTSRSGQSPLIAYPWGAHYIPAPMAHNRALIQLLGEVGVIEAINAEGQPIVGEQFLCRDPQERLFYNGSWQEGLYPTAGASDADLAQLGAFEQLVNDWVAWRDVNGRSAFTLPTAACSDDAEVRALDQLSMADWLAEHDLTSPRLKWLIDYCCRDDYGLRAEQTSAWAGLFYFASRKRLPGEESQPFVTWPEGNGRIVRHFLDRAGPRVIPGLAVTEIRPSAIPPSARNDANGSSRTGAAAGNLAAQSSMREVIAISHDGSDTRGFRAQHVIFAAPQFLAPYLIPDFSAARRQVTEQFEYGSWMVANLHLRNRPPEQHGFPLAWDNVIYDSKSLGYVAATHQQNMEYGPTVFTYYYPLCDDDANVSRQWLLDLSWEDCAEIALADLQVAHPEIRGLTTRLDVMKWGHAMIRPTPGFITHPARAAAARPLDNIHFANTDLSGVPLLEESLDHGVRAAEQIAAARGARVDALSDV